jgi:pectinesterase
VKNLKRPLSNLVASLACSLLAFSSALSARADTHVTVAADGSGQYTRLQDALNAVPAANAAPYVIDIKAGTYSMASISDQFMVDSPYVTLNGLGASPSNVVITGKYVASATPNDKYQHATVVVIGDNFTAKNVTFANTLGDNLGQGLAIYAKADRLTFVNCRFLGWQDTLRAEYGRQFYENCYIEGDVDFIYGHATGYFKNCSLYVKSDGYVTAPDTLLAGDYRSKGLVLSGCTITGPTANTGYLGRPWNAGGLSVFLNCKIGPVIKAVGWFGSAGQATFAEYRSTDLNGTLLSVASRVSWSVQLTSAQTTAYAQNTWLVGPDNWVPVGATGSSYPAVGTWKLRSRTADKYLDSLGAAANSSSCCMYSGGTSNNQRWVLSYPSTGVAKLACVTGGIYLDSLGRTASGSYAGLYASNTTNNQRWTLIDVGGGYWKLKNLNTGLCLDVGASPWTNADPVEMWPDGSSQNQHWQFVAP